MIIKSFQNYKRLDKKEKNFLYTEVLIDMETKVMINFCIILFYIDKTGEKRTVVQHDLSHGGYNKHTYFLESSSRKEIKTEESANALYQKIKDEIRKNWIEYSIIFVRRHFPHELENEH